MTPEQIVKLQSKNAREITFLRLAAGGLLLICLLEMMLLFRTVGAEKIIVTPPTIEKSFWVSADGASKSYLEQMAYWYAGLALSTTKETGKFQKEMFLKYASPAKYGQLEAAMNARLDFLEKNSASTLFTARTMTVNEKLMRVAITGDLETFVQEKRVSVRPVVYVVAFKNMNGRLFVDEFKETDEKNIFGIDDPAVNHQ